MRAAHLRTRGGDAEHNARELIRVFTGEDKGAHRDALLMGTSLVLEVQGDAKDAKDGVAQAAAAIDDGRAETFLGSCERTSKADERLSAKHGEKQRGASRGCTVVHRRRLRQARRAASLDRFGVIAEIKERSPAEGPLAQERTTDTQPKVSALSARAVLRRRRRRGDFRPDRAEPI